MKSFVLFVVIGAALAGFYGHRQLGPNTARTIADVRSIPINESDAHARRARAATIGWIQGLHLSGVMIPAIAGAVLGVFGWLVWKAFVWLFA
jgi:nitrate reductase NapE component